MARLRFLDEGDHFDDGVELDDQGSVEVEEDEEGLLDAEETLEELDVDDRGHVRPRRRRQDDEEIDPAEY